MYSDRTQLIQAKVAATFALLTLLLATVREVLTVEFWEGYRAGRVRAAQVGPAQAAREGLLAYDRAQIGGRNIVGYFVAILVAGIVGVAVTVPIMQDVISQANLTGTTATIASFIPTLLLVVFVVYVISPITGQ